MDTYQQNSAAAPREGLAKVAEAATYLNVGRSSVYRMMDAGTLPYVKLGGCRRIRWSDVFDVIERNSTHYADC